MRASGVLSQPSRRIGRNRHSLRLAGRFPSASFGAEIRRAHRGATREAICHGPKSGQWAEALPTGNYLDLFVLGSGTAVGPGILSDGWDSSLNASPVLSTDLQRWRIKIAESSSRAGRWRAMKFGTERDRFAELGL